ncbi:MAG TPA: hypothetical protein VFP65_05635 [Anaeromyxobacteraceae bacterium]|nr:hypothetical protein [Anaeromyxobacteraceae bacterium]
MRSRTKAFALLTMLAPFLWSGSASAALYPQPPATSAFTITGFIQTMTLDNPADVLSGGTVTVNGVKVTIPRNTIVIMSASNISWQEVWAYAPCPWGLTTKLAGQALPVGACATAGNGQTGLALTDSFVDPATGAVTKPLTTNEVTIMGNRIGNGTADPDHVAGLVYMAQHALNLGSGIINYIDYATGTLHVGGAPGAAGPRDTLIQINDPVGRYGRVMSPDPRFTSDTDNPTIHAKTGYPMCIPRAIPPAAVLPGVAPPAETDPLCPQRNRPLDPAAPKMPLGNFTVCNPGASGTVLTPPSAGCFANSPPTVVGVINALATPVRDPATGASTSDATNQAPFQVGDAIEWSGTLQLDTTGITGSVGLVGTPLPRQYVSAWNIVANVGIYTSPFSVPAYLEEELTILGTGGTPITAPVPVPQESTTRIKARGFFTDPTRQVDLFAVVVDPCSGAESEIMMLGSIPNQKGGVPWGRFRDVDQAGLFPITRQWRVRYTPFATDPPGPVVAANGLTAMSFTLPVSEFITPENTVYGDPTLLLVPNNFQDFPFLAQGEGPWRGDPLNVVGQLTPFPLTNSIPGLTPPAPAPITCPTATAPTAIITPTNQTVKQNSQVWLNAAASHSNPTGNPLTFVWSQLSGPPVALDTPAVCPGASAASAACATFKAPNVTANTGMSFQVLVTDTITRQSSLATTLVIVSPFAVGADTVVVTGASYRVSRGVLNVTATSSDQTCAAVLTVQAFASNGSTMLPANTNMVAGPPVAGLPCPYSFVTGKAVFPPAGTSLTKVTVLSSEGGSGVCPNGTTCSIVFK